MKLSFRNRITFHYMLATAVIMGAMFGFVYFIVHSTVHSNLDDEVSYEAYQHIIEIQFSGDSISFINMAEWEEREHQEIQVNPVFVQLIGADGRLMDKSPNLKLDFLSFDRERLGTHFDAVLSSGRSIRQLQVPLEDDGVVKGYILAAISSESEKSVLRSLGQVLIISYLFVLGGLYFISRFLAGRSIVPVKIITQTINRITRNNLNERVELPQHRDELHNLSSSFNELLQRIEKAMEREKQFTSDASHELRTPLAALRGTLEVLIRKPRSEEEYQEKIKYSLLEIDRMTSIIEQLLLLARLDSSKDVSGEATAPLATLVDETLDRYHPSIIRKSLRISLDIQTPGEAFVPQYYSSLIIDNVIGNAIKYSPANAGIEISICESDGRIICKVKDEGIGIKTDDLKEVFDNFFRSDSLEHKYIPGNGLGLSIARKSADAIRASLSVESTLNQGSTFTVTF